MWIMEYVNYFHFSKNLIKTGFDNRESTIVHKNNLFIKKTSQNCNFYVSGDPSEQCRTAVTSCTTCSSNVQPIIERRCCCSSSLERPICKKPIFRCRQPCTVESQSCGGGGCCGGGCRGGCGKPGQTCLPAKSCVVPPCRPCSPCSPPRSCSPQVICCCGPKSGNCCGNGGSTCCCR